MTTLFKQMGFATVVCCTLSAQAWAAPAIQSITATQQAGTDVVRIELSEPLTALPPGFVVQSPPRIAIDLPGVSNGLGRAAVDVNQGNLRTVNVAQAGDRTRLVLNLRQAANYKATLQGNALLLTLESQAQVVAVPAPAEATPARASSGTVHFADDRNAAPLALRDIDFRRGQDGSGRVVVELPNNQVGVDIKHLYLQKVESPCCLVY